MYHADDIRDYFDIYYDHGARGGNISRGLGCVVRSFFKAQLILRSGYR